MLSALCEHLARNAGVLLVVREYAESWIERLPLDPRWLVLLGAVLPVVEGRYAVLLGHNYFHLPLIESVLLASLGNVIVTWPIYLLTGLALRAAAQRGPLRLAVSHAQKAAKKQEQRIRRYGPVALVVFAAIPLPGAGVWTGAMAAAALDLPPRTAFLSVALGGILSVVLVAATAHGAGAAWGLAR